MLTVAAELAELPARNGNSHFRLADTPRLFRDLDAWIRHRLRALQLKHWKNESTVYRELRARGLSERRRTRSLGTPGAGGETQAWRSVSHCP